MIQITRRDTYLALTSVTLNQKRNQRVQKGILQIHGQQILRGIAVYKPS